MHIIPTPYLTTHIVNKFINIFVQYLNIYAQFSLYYHLFTITLQHRYIQHDLSSHKLYSKTLLHIVVAQLDLKLQDIRFKNLSFLWQTLVSVLAPRCCPAVISQCTACTGP